MIHNFHKAAVDKSAAAGLALNAGIDVELPVTDCYCDPLKIALEAGDVSLELVDNSVRRHLQKKFEIGLFEKPYVDENHVYEVFETVEQRVLALELARKSMVLLKNDGLLPLKKAIGTLAVIGPNANEGRNQLGDYSYAAVLDRLQIVPPENSSFSDCDPAALAMQSVKVITALDGIRAAVSPTTKVLFAKGCDNLADNRDGFNEAIKAAEQAEVVVLVLGDRSGLDPSCTTGETRDSVDLRLPGLQEELARAIISIGKPTVVVLVNGRPLALPWLDEVRKCNPGGLAAGRRRRHSHSGYFVRRRSTLVENCPLRFRGM